MRNKEKNIVIVGAGVAGTDVYKEIKKNKSLSLKVLGFIDDDPEKLGKKINDIKILGSQKDLPELIKTKKIKQIIIAIPSANGEKIAQYVKICSLEKVDVRIVPRVREIIEGQAHIKTLRKVEVEDLLGRPIIKADVRQLKNFFQEKTILVTGAAGSIGSELSRQIIAYKPKKILLLDWWENGIFDLRSEIEKSFPSAPVEFIIANIQDVKKTSSIFSNLKPNIVFNAAAYKHVYLMEEYPEEAIKNNVFGTLNLVRESIKWGVEKFVLVSTDKAANPKNVMGATKLITEAIGKYYNKKNKTKYMSVRFGNVLDSFGSVVPIFRKQIEEEGPITITDKKMTRYFMTIPEAAQLILKAASMGRGGELFVLDMGEPVKIIDLAQNMIRLSGLIPEVDIQIVYTGKRKGEKIRERLFNKKEMNSLIKTKDKKIFITESLGIDLKKLPLSLKRLKIVVNSGSNKAIRKEISRLVKTFIA